MLKFNLTNVWINVKVVTGIKYCNVLIISLYIKIKFVPSIIVTKTLKSEKIQIFNLNIFCLQYFINNGTQAVT